MRELTKVYVNIKTGELKVSQIEKSNLATQFLCKIQEGQKFNGFQCEKDELDSMFKKFKKMEIDERLKRIKQLEKEIKNIEALKLSE